MRRCTVLMTWVLTLASAALLSPSSVAAEGGQGQITADLEGRSIPPTEVGRYFCHDFEYPHIRCFSSARELEAASGDGNDASGWMVAPYGSGDYLTVYSEPSYAGTYAHLSQNYDGLWAIGWNDRIRSFKARNGISGSFYTDWYASGSRYDFCCNSSVPVLTSAYDRAFSSVYRD